MAKKDVQENLQEEFVTEQAIDTSAPSAEEAAAEAKDTRTWEVDGANVTKSEFIRHQFTVNNLNRKQIAEQFDIPYRTVYGATMNMANEAEASTRGRSATSSKILVSAANQVITQIEGVYHLDNVAVEDADGIAATETAQEVDRNTWIKSEVASGRERGEIAKVLGLSYGVIYNLTKEAEGSKQRHEIEYNGETISRSEYIRRKYAEGMSKAEIAKELGVDYPVVWSALKGTKSDQEKFADAVDKIAKFADLVVDGEAFAALLGQLQAVELKAEEVTEEVTEPAAEGESVYVDAE
jgi:transposase